MTLVEIEDGVRILIKEHSTEAGALFPADNVKLDFFINTACEMVVMDLVPFMKKIFTLSEAISLIAGTSAYTMTANPLQFMGLYLTKSGFGVNPIREYELAEIPLRMITGETAEDPVGYYVTGAKTINFFPKPSVSYANYALMYFVPQEAAAMAAGGPVVIPAPAHRLVPIKAAIAIMGMNDQSSTSLQSLYQEFLGQIRLTYATRTQGQPRTLLPDFDVLSRGGGDSRDRAFYDVYDPFR